MATPHPGPASALVFEGRCWKFGGKIPTDAMAEFFARDVRQVLADQNARFPLEIRPGDIVVAGVRFGQSSGRALAAKALQAMGIGGVVAESAARTFFRNRFEIGLPLLECPGVSGLVADGDRVAVDIDRGLVRNLSTGREARTQPPDPFLREMLRIGGIIPSCGAARRGRGCKPDRRPIAT